MEYVLIHRAIGPMPPEVMKNALEMSKKLLAEPTSFVPGGKIIAAYTAYAKSLIVCIWETPSIDALTPFLEQVWAVGWETEVIPAEKMEAAIPKLEKMLAQMVGS